ncbi:MAG: hypothetical protein K2J23_05295, partial [Muribaculaceae bacterium]|nr:hypothetical protein [Muribaculaceae bacterium]
MNWYAIKTSKPLALSKELEARGCDTYLPLEEIHRADGSIRRRPLISRLLFLHSDRTQARAIEQEARNEESPLPALWIYRNKPGEEITPIPEAQV